VSRCPERDVVWDRRCDKEIPHTGAETAEERLHENDQPGDRLCWGSASDMREAARERERLET
jgi:hypothetical protein